MTSLTGIWNVGTWSWSCRISNMPKKGGRHTKYINDNDNWYIVFYSTQPAQSVNVWEFNTMTYILTCTSPWCYLPHWVLWELAWYPGLQRMHESAPSLLIVFPTHFSQLSLLAGLCDPAKQGSGICVQSLINRVSFLGEEEAHNFPFLWKWPAYERLGTAYKYWAAVSCDI